MVLKICVICECQFEAKGSSKTCSTECGSVHKSRLLKVRRDANPEKYRARNNAHYAANVERYLAKSKANYVVNAEKVKERSRIKRAMNPEKTQAYWDRWLAKNPTGRLDSQRSRRRNKRSLIGQIEAQMALLAAEES